jgi:hypothetical protein
MPLRADGFKPSPYTDSGTRASVDATAARMRAMRGRALGTCLGAIISIGLAATPASALSFGPAHRASTRYSWNPGKSLVATPNRLLTIWATDCPPPLGRCADDDGPRMGVFVRRSWASKVPPDWSAPKRLSPGTIQAERPSIAAEGTTVIASYVRQRSYLHYHPLDPRSVWIRVSTDQGKTWRSPVRLSSPAGRVDYPRVAIGNGRLFAVWTGAGTGEIRFAWSDDLGRHWSKETIATTTSRPLGAAEGFAGLPDVGASGDNVVVAWFATDDGVQKTLTSATGGDDLAGATPTQLTGPSPNRGEQYLAVAGADDPADPRVAIAFTTHLGLDVVTFDGATLSSPSTVFTWKVTVGGVGYEDGYGPAVLPFDTASVAVAVAACRHNPRRRDPCNAGAKGSRIDVVYRVSTDDGSTWQTARRLTDASDRPYRINDEPSIALTGQTHRVSYDRYERSFKRYDVWLRSSK